MTSAALHIMAPTLSDRALLGIAKRLTAFVEKRSMLRAERREIALDMLREQQARKSCPGRYEDMLAEMGLPRR